MGAKASHLKLRDALLKGVLALVLAIACVPAEALATDKQAWGSPWGYAAFYQNEGEDGYTLVLQSTSTADSSYGQLVKCEPLDGDSLRVDTIDPELAESTTKTVVRDPMQAPQNLSYCFSDMSKCASFDLEKLDTSQVTNMQNLFYGCSSLGSLDLSGLDTSQVADMSWMFQSCSALKSLDLSGLGTSKVADMGGMFSWCSSLGSLDLSGLDTSLATSMRSMFDGCSSLGSLGLSGLDTSKVAGMGGMFQSCSALKSLDLSGLDTSQVADMSWMFSGCDLLSRVVLPSGASRELGAELPYGTWMHESGQFFTSDNFPDQLGGVYTISSINPEPTEPDPDNPNETGQAVWATMYLKNGEYTLVFQEKQGNEGSRGSKVGETAVTLSDSFRVQNLFSYGDNLSSFDIYPQHIAFSGTIKPASLAAFFKSDYSDGPLAQVRTIDLHGLNSSHVSTMSGMFEGCSGLTTLDLSPLDASFADSMNNMFSGCSALKSLNLSGLNAMPMDTYNMFLNCSSLESVNLSGLDTSSDFDMSGMFKGCSSLKSLDMSGMSIYQVSDMTEMFAGCSKLESVKLPKDEEEEDPMLGGMARMFYNCTALKTLDLSPLNTANIGWNGGSSSKMLYGCTSLSSLALRPGSKITKKGFYPYATSNVESCTSENSSIASISSDGGSLSAVALGSTRLKFSISGQNGFSYLNVIVKEPDAKSPVTPGITKPAPAPTPSTTPSKSTPTSLAKAQVTVKSKAYTGKTLKPSSVTVKVGGKKLVSGRDYTVSCKGGKAVGSCKVTITGKGNYTGTKTAAFKILPKGTSVSKVKAAKRGFTVTWKKPSKANLKQTTGYKVQWSTDKKFKKAVKSKLIKKSKTASLKVSKLKGGKKYYVRVCTYKKVGGKYYYSSWSKAKAVKTKK